MNKIFWQTVFSTVIGTGIASSIVALPAKANKPDLVFSQNYTYSDRPSSTDGDNLRNIIGLTGLAIGTGVVGYHLSRAYKPSVANLPTNNTGSLLDRVTPKLRQELLRLVHNRATADRLLSGTLNSHPYRSPNWLAEKVIYDLKRDR